MNIMSNKKRFAILAIAASFALSPMVSAQDSDSVLNQARQKYQSARAKPSPSPVAIATPAPTAIPTTVTSPDGTSTSTTTITSGTDKIHVTTNVTVNVNTEPTVQSPVANQPIASAQPVANQMESPIGNTETDIATSSPTAAPTKELPYKGFNFQPLPFIDRDALESRVGIALGLITSGVGELDGAQISIFGNQVTGNAVGLQMASLWNSCSGNMVGVQLSNGVNIAGDIKGAQIGGVLNIAHDVSGVQFGLVNIANEMDGIAIGLISVNKTTINERFVSFSNTDFAYAGIQLGYKGIYLLGYGGAKEKDWGVNWNHSSTWGLSLGYRATMGNFYLQADGGVRANLVTSRAMETYSTWNYTTKNYYSVTSPSLSNYDLTWKPFGNLRLTAGFKFWGPFGVFAGVNADIDRNGNTAMPGVYNTDWKFSLPGNLRANLSCFAGLTF